MKIFQSTTLAELDYTRDWSGWLQEGESIATSTWTVPSPLTEPSVSTKTSTTATVWIGTAAAEPGEKYLIGNSVVTSAGRKSGKRTFVLEILEPMG